MAYDFFPKTVDELQKKISNHTADVQGELFLLFVYLKEKFPSLETPMNLDLNKRSSANVSRAIQEDTTISKIKQDAKINKLSMKFGNGSSGNRGVNNRGNLFESQFGNALIKWHAGESVSDSNLLRAIEDLDKTYGLRHSKTLKVLDEGAANTKRPIVYSPKLIISNPENTGTNVGKSVTDLTLVKDNGEKIYLSLKMGSTVTFFNVGVRTVFPPDEIKAYNITSSDGKKLFKLFGIDEKMFCDVFNGKSSSGVTVTPTFNRSNMMDFMKSGIGEGYHIIHKLAGSIKSKKMDSSALTKAATITSIKVYYGGKTGTGKRVDIEMESSTYKFKLNIRDTQGKDGYPTRLLCDFSYK